VRDVIRGVIAALVFALAAGTAAAQPAPPARSSELAAEIAALRDELAELRAAVVQLPTVAAGLQEIERRLAVIEQRLAAVEQGGQTRADRVEAIDALAARIDALEREVASLRAGGGGVVIAATASGVGEVAHDGAFAWETDDGRAGIALTGVVQTRLLATSAELDDVDEATLALRRARFGASGHLGGRDVMFALLFETAAAPAALDYYLEHRVHDAFVLRAGQYKTPYTRSFATDARRLAFPERPEVIERFRYDRDVQVGARGQLAARRVAYQVAVGNGAGPNAVNDNIDFVPAARVEIGVVGPVFEPADGDLERSPSPRLVIGGGALHDLVAVPTALAGIELDGDVDADGDRDNVRVISAGVDAAFRWRGLALQAEWLLRREDWGSILDDADNTGVRAALDRIAGDGATRTYQGVVGEATYFVAPARLLIGARAAWSHLPLLGVGGRASAPERGATALELGGLAQIYCSRFGGRALGVHYALTRHDDRDGDEVEKVHRVIVEAQLAF
jgi:hypothetical protein